MLYRRVAEKVEAWRINLEPRPDWVQRLIDAGRVVLHASRDPENAENSGLSSCEVKTWHGGTRRLGLGDYVTCDGEGRVDAQRAAVFQEHYQPAGTKTCACGRAVSL